MHGYGSQGKGLAVAGAMASGGVPPLSTAQRANANLIVASQLAYVPRTVMGTPPTLSNSGGSTSIGSSSDGNSVNSIKIRDPAKIRASGPLANIGGADFLGVNGTWSQYGASSYGVGGAGWGYGFVLTGSQFELVTGINANTRIRLRVNGQWASASQWSKADFGNPADTDYIVLKFNFGGSTATVRTIEIFVSFMQFNGAYINIPSASASLAIQPVGVGEVLARAWGDSFYEAAYANSTGMDIKETTPNAIMEALGVINFAPAGRSNQGWVGPGLVDGQTFETRISANVGLLSSRTLELINDSINDNAVSPPLLYAAKLQGLKNLRAGTPNAIIASVGPYNTASVAITDANYAACKQAALDFAKIDGGFVFVETRDLPTIQGGAVLPNGQTQVNWDAIHPGRAWSNYVGGQVASRLTAALQARLAA